MFVQDDRYVSIGTTALRTSYVSGKEAERLNLPRRPVFRPFIKGTPCEPPPAAMRRIRPESTTQRYAPPGDFEIATMALEDMVEGVPFQKTVSGLRLGGVSPHVVVEADPGKFYAAGALREGSRPTTLRRLDIEVPDDKRLVDLFLEYKGRMRVLPEVEVMGGTFKNISEHLLPRAHPSTSIRDAAFNVLTMRDAQRRYVETCRSSLDSRELFDPARHRDDVAIYQVILGQDHVFAIDDAWNIGNAAGIADLRKHLCGGNIAFASLRNEDGRIVYFATSNSLRVTALELDIHKKMGNSDEVTLGDVTFVDAKRRLKRISPTSGPGRQSGLVNLPVLSVSDKAEVNRLADAEQVLATVIVHDMRESPIVTGIHVNSLLDTCDSCASALSILQQRTGHSVDFVYHRDYGVTVANSTHRTIHLLQTVAATASALRAHLLVQDVASMRIVARRLLTPELLVELTISLRFSEGNQAEQLAFHINVDYLRLLASLLNEDILTTHATVSALMTEPGCMYVALCGHRAPALRPLAEAWATLLHELRRGGVERDKLLGILSRKSRNGSFYHELLDAPRVYDDCRRALFNYLRENALIPSYREMRDFNGVLGAAVLSFRLRPRRRRVAPMETKRYAVAVVIDNIRRVISEPVLHKLEAERLTTRLRETLPAITIREQRDMREMINGMVQAAWTKSLPGEHAPSSLVGDIVDDVGPAYGRNLVDARAPAIDAIIEAEVQAYCEHLRTHPDADEHALHLAFESHLASAKSAHRQMLLQHGERTTAVAERVSEIADLADRRVGPETVAIASARAAESLVAATHAAQRAAQQAKDTASSVIERNRVIKEKAKQKAIAAAQAASYAACAAAQNQSAQRAAEKAKKEAAERTQREIDAREQAWDKQFAQRMRALRGITTPQLQQRLDKFRSDAIVDVGDRLQRLRDTPTSSQSRTTQSVRGNTISISQEPEGKFGTHIQR